MNETQDTTAAETKVAKEKDPLPVFGKADILSTELRRIRIDVPEWGASVWLQELTMSERDEYEAETLNQPDPFDLHAVLSKPRTPIARFREVRAGLLSRSIVDADGKRLFTKAEIEQLGTKSGKAIQRLFNEAARLSGLS